MKITVCELPSEPADLADAWPRLINHVTHRGSELVLLPEMPFYRWLSQSRDVDSVEWQRAVEAHDRWIERLDELAPATVISSRPVVAGDSRLNVGFFWEKEIGAVDVHAKYYLPDEAGFWEASWYHRGDGDFSIAHTSKAKIGFLICTELWFSDRARDYGKRGVQVIACPRATPSSKQSKWPAGGRAAAVVSGAFCISSNLAGRTIEGGDFAGVGWIAEPDQGAILGQTGSDDPFLTLDVDLAEADRAKNTYPRYVQEGP
jgi:N-carbamoylputrescine amidase